MTIQQSLDKPEILKRHIDAEMFGVKGGVIAMVGLLTFTKGILCKKEVLGETYSAQIAGINVEISFPRILDSSDPDELKESNLLPPAKGSSFRRGDEEIAWGHPVNYPNLSSFVKCALVEVSCQEHECEAIAQKLYAAIKKWGDAVISYCQLCSKQGIYRDKNGQATAAELELLSADGYIYNKNGSTIYLYAYPSDVSVSKQQLEQAMIFAASGKELLLEYQMLLSAYEARRKLQNRQAIIDACSAAELCLVDKIKDYCGTKDMEAEILLDKYKSIGDRFRLVEKIDGNSIAVDYNNLIVKPRNDIAHNREVYPTDKTTDELISAVEQYLEHYHTRYY